MNENNTDLLKSQDTPMTLLAQSILFTSIFATGVLIFLKQIMLPNIYQYDLFDHLKSVNEMTFSDMLSHSHPGFAMIVSALANLLNISYEASAVTLLSFSLVLLAYVIKKILANKLDQTYSLPAILFFTLTMVLVTAVYLPFFNLNVFIGQGSPNTWHSPTTIMAKPFAYIVFHLVVLLLAQSRFNIKQCIILAVVLFWATIVKPNYALALIPAAGIYILCCHLKKPKAYIKAAIIALPVLILLVVQFFNTFGSDGGSSLGIGFLTVWKTRSPSVPISILLALAFPLCILIFRFKNNFKSHLLLAWLFYIVATLQKAFLYEGGERMAHNNWGRAYQAALQLLFIYCTVEMLKWFKNADLTKLSTKIKLSVTTTAFSLHLVSGIYYLGKYLAGYGFN